MYFVTVLVNSSDWENWNDYSSKIARDLYIQISWKIFQIDIVADSTKDYQRASNRTKLENLYLDFSSFENMLVPILSFQCRRRVSFNSVNDY